MKAWRWVADGHWRWSMFRLLGGAQVRLFKGFGIKDSDVNHQFEFRDGDRGLVIRAGVIDTEVCLWSQYVFGHHTTVLFDADLLPELASKVMDLILQDESLNPTLVDAITHYQMVARLSVEDS